MKRTSRGLYAIMLACGLNSSARCQTGYDFNWSLDSWVYNLALQPDGRILVAAPHSSERLNADGSLDANFRPASTTNFWMDPTIYCWAVQPDGKFLAGGDFNLLAGVARTNLCRMNADGTVDTNFVASADGTVFSIAVQPDGKLVIAGAFAHLNGLPRSSLGRLNGDGSVDDTFSSGSDGTVFSVAVQGNRGVLVGGSFSSLAGIASTNLGRLMPDGKFDASFHPNGIGFVNSFAGDADGKLLVSEAVTGPGRSLTNYLVRLNADGILDTNFNPEIAGSVYSIAVQAGGQILVGGPFNSVAGQPRYGIARLTPNGALDPSFNPLGYDSILALALQKNGRVLIGGTMQSSDGQTNGYVGRFENAGPATDILGLTGSTVTWLRGGTGPELWYASFEHSSNGVDWTNLGIGSRIEGGWDLSNVFLPKGELLRANGAVSSGQYNGPNWFVTSQVTVGDVQMPVILSQPVSQTTFEGSSALFSVQAGLEPLSYQWLKNGTNLPSATNAILFLSNLAVSDAGDYQVLVSNAQGHEVSVVASLKVNVRPAVDLLGFQMGHTSLWVSAQHCNRVIVESSTDLHYWTGLQTNFVGATSSIGFSLSDPLSSQSGARFYRVRQE